MSPARYITQPRQPEISLRQMALHHFGQYDNEPACAETHVTIDSD
jgi:hypothetical protein